MPSDTANITVPAPRRHRSPIWAWGSLVVALAIAMPILAVLVTAAAPGGEVWRHIMATTLPGMLANSVMLGLLVAILAGSAGAVAAWLVVACDFRGRRFLEIALLLPIAMPAYLCGYVYTWLLDVAGPVQGALRDLTGLSYGQYWFPEIRSLPGAAVMLAMVLYPYVYMLCRAAFLQQSVCLIEASRTLGHGLARSFLHVALPLARPALAAGIALVLMETLADFGTVQHFAVRSFTTGIYEAWFGMDNRPAAAQLSVALLGCVGLLLALECFSRGGRRFHATTTRHPALRPVRLRAWQEIAALLACGLPLLIGFVIPAAALFWLMVVAGDPFEPARYWPYARNSLVLAGITALLAVLLAAGMAWAARLYPSPQRALANRVAAMGYALPGSVIAVGVLVPLGLFDNALDSSMRARFGVSTGLLLSGSMAALIFAYLVRFLAVGLSTVEAGLARLKPSYTDAARVLGRRPGQAVREVEVPLTRGALMTAAILVFVDTMKELPATLIVRPFDLDTLAVRVYNLASDERLAEASTAAVLIVLVGLLPVAALTRMMRRA